MNKTDVDKVLNGEMSHEEYFKKHPITAEDIKYLNYAKKQKRKNNN